MFSDTNLYQKGKLIDRTQISGRQEERVDHGVLRGHVEGSGFMED